jgi:hypothetical protein
MWGLIAAGFVALTLMFGGSMWFAHKQGVDAGKAECEAEHMRADADLKDKAGKFEQEVANHESDMAVAADVAEKEGYDRAKREQTKGAQRVASNPTVYQNARSVTCTLPVIDVQTLNAARGSFRHPVADSLPDNANHSAGTGVGITANPGALDGTVRGTGPVEKGDVGGTVPADAGGRRPLGKVRP